MADLSAPIPKSKKSKSKKIKPSITLSNTDSIIHDHAIFFDKLIELIPPKFYITEEKPFFFQGLSKEKKKKAKKRTKENTKKARRDRFDPEKANKSTLDLLRETIEKEKAKKESVKDGFDVGGLAEEGEEKERAVTHEELRERFRRKLEELRGERPENVNQGKKRKRDDRRPDRRNVGEKAAEEEENERDVAKEAEEAADGIRFGKLKLSEGVVDVKNKKRRKLSKEKELERALKMEEEAKTNPEVAKKKAWKVAMDKAKGIKVHDDQRKLKESIKKEEKKHKKSKEKWEGRVESVETKRKERQEKRKENVKAKIDQKKQRKIEKREKKLLRPGFEGRKEGFINGD